MTLDQTQPIRPLTATDVLLQQTTPITVYALMLRSLTIVLHEHWDFFDGLIPDEANDETYSTKIGEALSTVAATLAEIAANASLPEMNATAENFRQFTDDKHVAAHVSSLQQVLALMKEPDDRYQDANKPLAA